MKRLLVLLALVASCGDEFEESQEEPACTTKCNLDPWCCRTPQTCWPNGAEFACLNAGQGALDQPCQIADGSPRCQQDLFCYQTAAIPSGLCRPFCNPADPMRACPNNGICDTLVLPSSGEEIHACRP